MNESMLTCELLALHFCQCFNADVSVLFYLQLAANSYQWTIYSTLISAIWLEKCVYVYSITYSKYFC